MKKEINKKINWYAIMSSFLSIVGIITALISLNALRYYRVFPSYLLLIFWLSPIVVIGSILIGLKGFSKSYRASSFKIKLWYITNITIGIAVLFVLYYIVVHTTNY